jgi:environmental stress-induced protein Ves
VKPIFRTHYKRLPWKNGLGSTEEIAIEPPNADFLRADFLWRMSSARLERATEFSLFPGYDRTIVALSGDGLKLSRGCYASIELMPLTAYEFSGDTSTSCELLGEPCDDFNIFVRRDKIIAKTAFVQIDGSFTWQPEGDWCFVFCCSGALRIESTLPSESAPNCIEIRDRDTAFTKTPVLLKGAAQVLFIRLKRI